MKVGVNYCRRSIAVLRSTLLAAAAGAVVVSACAAAPPESPQRARPPKWSADVLDAFFPDARDKLAGERPDYAGSATEPIVANRAPLATESRMQPKGDSAAWSQLIDAETIESEIKRLGQAVSADVTTPGEFKGGAYKHCRRHFSLLAVLFAVTSEYDGDVRWQDSAAGLRELFARAGYNCKVGTDGSYREAAERKQTLEDLVRGSRPQTPPVEPQTDWSRVADRAPLMQRLGAAHQERLTKWLANEREFKRNVDEVRHEAQLVAMLADVIAREGFEYWDDETFGSYAAELRGAANDISIATETENYDQARQALDRATKACANCHDGYRG